jgi:hypothetical protein
MIKKLVSAAVAGVFASVLAAPVVMACPGNEGKVAKKEQKSEPKTAQKVKAKKAKPDKAKSKGTTKKIVSKG